MVEPIAGSLDRDPPAHAAGSLDALVTRIEALVARRVESQPTNEPARHRAARLAEHLAAHVRPRVRSLEAPLLVLLFGPTGAGKSSLFNALAHRDVSRVGVLRPTTREVVVFVRPADREAILGEGAALARVDEERVQLVVDEAAPEGLALLDAPDLDSLEHANRELAEQLVESADLGVFVTSAVRYADRVPWDTLARVRERGLPLVVVLNRMPADPADAQAIVQDVRRLLSDAGIDALADGLAGAEPYEPPARRPGEVLVNSHDRHAGEVRIVEVADGELEPGNAALATEAVAPLDAVIAALSADRDHRRALAARALAGSLAGLAPALDTLADDAEHEAIDVDALGRTARDIFLAELRVLRDELAHGSFLRAEAIRQWHEFVGADEVTRIFSRGIGKLRGTLSAIIRGMPKAPVSEVRDEALEDLMSLTKVRLADAVRRTAAAWAGSPVVADRIDADPGLWSPAPDLDDRIRGRLADWATSIADDVRTTGGTKRTLAKGASIGVNAAGIGVMLATFSHTAGLTGAEVGVAAATAFLNQKLLEALFGEAALVEMIGRARQRLVDQLSEVFGEELERFERLITGADELRAIVIDARAAAAAARELPAGLPHAARAVITDPETADWPAPDPTLAAPNP